jgi:hypothetical protein
MPTSVRARDLAAFEHVLSRLGLRPDSIYNGFTFSHGKEGFSPVAGALVMVAVGLVSARLLRHPTEGHGS